MPASVKLPPLRVPPVAPVFEGDAWKEIEGVWRPLHGSFTGNGLSIEWHDFRLSGDLDWGRSFHPASLEICLNFSGHGWIGKGASRRDLGPNQLAVYVTPAKPVRASRLAGHCHRFATIELSALFLRWHFGDVLSHLKGALRDFVESDAVTSPWLDIFPLPADFLAFRQQLVEPPVPDAARPIWYLGRVLEILSHTLFDVARPAELFCERHLRSTRERIIRARYLLERDLENPPSLEMLAAEVGCSPFYLSRIFAAETGTSIPKYLRLRRIEKAAAYLRSREMNVTQAAMAVGYTSLSAFTRAFVEQMGCCPGLY